MAEELSRPTSPRALRAVPADGPLTAHMRSLGRAVRPEGKAFASFWQAFCEVVRSEVARRGLAAAPPRHLGIEGESWNRAAFEELTCECYAFLLQRLRSLSRQLRFKSNVDGLVILNVRHCLHERQKRSDPLGFRVYEMTHAAVLRAVEAGRLEISGGNPSIDNRTFLAAVGSRAPDADPAPQLVTFAQSVSDELMPDLVTARGRRKERTLLRLEASVGELGEVGVGRFFFKDLVDACKKAVRVRWSALWQSDLGEVAEEPDHEWRSLVPVVQPRLDFEERQSWDNWTDCVTQALGEISEEGHRGHLETLWLFLRSQAPRPERDALPSRREVARILDVPRYLLPQLYRRLGELIHACRGSMSGIGDPNPEGPSSAPGEIEG